MQIREVTIHFPNCKSVVNNRHPELSREARMEVVKVVVHQDDEYETIEKNDVTMDIWGELFETTLTFTRDELDQFISQLRMFV